MMRLTRRVSVIVCACLFLFLTVSGTAFAAGVGTHPHIDASDHTKITNGCTTIRVHGTGFTPSNGAIAFTIASTDHLADGFAFLPSDARGRVAGPLQVCGITVARELIQIVAQDLGSGFYSNTTYTIARLND